MNKSLEDMNLTEIEQAFEELHAAALESEEVEASGEMEKGMGTPLAEYSEDGPFSCMDCWYLQNREPRSEPKGRCNEPHMMKDPKTKKDDTGLAIVNKRHGCCRWVDPVKCEGVDEDFVVANDSKKEEKEHLT
jgi:hypothetical protein